ncbi:MAG: hypothetical protein NW224_04280, partial [Leptolyngbyaceae cyanobacterium bins.302]|nr:hypothetical protein [Leptolyngbyaceae cyanobacterium bins.302]
YQSGNNAQMVKVLYYQLVANTAPPLPSLEKIMLLNAQCDTSKGGMSDTYFVIGHWQRMNDKVPMTTRLSIYFVQLI